MKDKDAVRAAREMAGIRSDRELLAKCGLKESTYYRKKNLDDLKLWQLREIINATDMPDFLILEAVKGARA